MTLSILLLLADLTAVRAEPNLEKRSDLALQNADAALTHARESYKAGDDKAHAAALEEFRQSLDLAKLSLDESGKNARRSPKYFKKAEIGIRQFIRRLDNLKIEMSVDDRAPLEALIERAHKIHDEILEEIMGKGKKK